MAGVLSQARWTRKPPVWARLSRRASFAPALVAAWMHNQGGGPIRELISGNSGSLISGFSWVPGPSLYVTGSSTGIDTGFSPSFGTGDFACFVRCKIGSATDYNGACGNYTGGNYFMLLSRIPGSFYVFYPFVSGTTYRGTTDINDGGWHNLLLNRRNGVIAAITDGNTEDGGTNTADVNGGNLFIGDWGSGHQQPWNGGIDTVQLFNRGLTDAEISALNANPYAILAGPPMRRVVSAGGGSSVFNVTGSGGLSLNGAASTQTTFAKTSTGGVTVGGSASKTVIFTPPSTGGVTLGGAASTAQTNTAVGSGGLSLSGTGSTATTFNASATGGMALNGSGAAAAVFNPSAGGAITLGGSGSAAATFTKAGSGGVTLGGSAPVSSTGIFTVVGSGGIGLSGNAATGIVFVQIASGGVVISGVAGVSEGGVVIGPVNVFGVFSISPIVFGTPGATPTLNGTLDNVAL